MTTLEQAQADFRAATAAYETAKRGVSDQRFAVQNCMPNSLGFAEMVEYTAHQNWLRAHEKLAALQPAPAPKPVTTSAPKPASAATIARNAPTAGITVKNTSVMSHENALREYHAAKADADRARAAFQVADRRLQQAHNAAVAAANARHTSEVGG